MLCLCWSVDAYTQGGILLTGSIWMVWAPLWGTTNRQISRLRSCAHHICDHTKAFPSMDSVMHTRCTGRASSPVLRTFTHALPCIPYPITALQAGKGDIKLPLSTFRVCKAHEVYVSTPVLSCPLDFSRSLCTSNSWHLPSFHM